MNSVSDVIHDVESRMKKSIDVLQQNFSNMRGGRANAGMVENIRVDYYGTMTPIKQLANITIPEPRMLLIHPWDVSALKAVEKAVSESDLGIAPLVDGKILRISIPPLTRERREELAKLAKKVAEEGRVSIRSLRREANEKIKQLEKDKKISEDEDFKGQDDIQKLTDKYIKLIDQSQSTKEQEFIQN